MAGKILVQIGCFAFCAPFGILFGFSAVNGLVQKFIKKDVDTFWISTAQFCGLGVGLAAGCLFLGRRNSNVGGGSFGRNLSVMVAGQSVLVVGLALTYKTIQISLTQVILSLGAVVGLGVGLGFSSAFHLSAAANTPADRGGIRVGALLSSFSLGAILITLCSRFAEDNISGIPRFFLAAGLVFFLGQTAAVCGVAYGLHDMKKVPTTNAAGTDFQQRIAKSQDGGRNDAPSRTRLLRSTIATKQFSMLWLTFFCNAIVTSYYMGSAIQDLEAKVVVNGDYAAMVTSVALVFHGVGSAFWGHVLDCVGCFWMPMCFCCLTLTAAFVLLPLVGKTYLGFAFITWVISFFSSANFVLVPAEMVRAFGPQRGVVATGILGIGIVIAAPLISVLVGSVLRAIHVLGLSLIVGGCSAVAAWSAFWKRPEERPEVKDVRRSIRDFFHWEWIHEEAPPA